MWKEVGVSTGCFLGNPVMLDPDTTFNDISDSVIYAWKPGEVSIDPRGGSGVD
jgi:hypothetical protein